MPSVLPDYEDWQLPVVDKAKLELEQNVWEDRGQFDEASSWQTFRGPPENTSSIKYDPVINVSFHNNL